jgi:uncharacterized low-complexity protein
MDAHTSFPQVTMNLAAARRESASSESKIPVARFRTASALGRASFHSRAAASPGAKNPRASSNSSLVIHLRTAATVENDQEPGENGFGEPGNMVQTKKKEAKAGSGDCTLDAERAAGFRFLDALSIVATRPLQSGPSRSEPRARKRQPKPYQMLTKPRHKMKVSASRNYKQS